MFARILHNGQGEKVRKRAHIMRKMIGILALWSLSITLLVGCGDATMTKQDEVSFTDALGYPVSITQPQRVAALTGSLADAWQLAGGTVCAATEDAKDMIQWEDSIVNLGSIKEPNVELLIASDIDFVILSAAVSGDVDIRETLENAGITTAYFDVEVFSDYSEMMRIMTDITGRKDLFEMNVTNIQTAIQEQIARQDGSNPTVLFLRAYSSNVTVKDSNHMTGQMLKELGCINIADSDSSLLQELSMESIIEQDPDYIFVTTMGDSEEDALAMVDELLKTNPAWNELQAVKNQHYYVLDKALFNSKPNERWAESYQILADDLYGEE